MENVSAWDGQDDLLQNLEIPEEEVRIDPIESPDDTPEEDIVFSFLKEQGIDNPAKLTFENEDGEQEEVNFNSLSREEQLTILKEITNPGLSDHESDVIRYLRANDVTLEQVVDYYANQKLEEYLNENPNQRHLQSYSVDDYSDEELFLADIKSKFPSFSNEELQQELDRAIENEDLFKKKVEILRETYKAEEQEQIELNEQQVQQQFDDLKNNLSAVLYNFNEIPLDFDDPQSDVLAIEDEDKNQVLSYLLAQDKNGKSQFVKDIENPETLVTLAWLATQGMETITETSRYWKDVLKTERKKIAALEREIESLKTRGVNTVIINKEEKSSAAGSTMGSIWDSTKI